MKRKDRPATGAKKPIDYATSFASTTPLAENRLVNREHLAFVVILLWVTCLGLLEVARFGFYLFLAAYLSQLVLRCAGWCRSAWRFARRSVQSTRDRIQALDESPARGLASPAPLRMRQT